PALAELLFHRRRRAVAAPGRGASRVTPCHRGAVERRVERVLFELEPAPERLARPPAPRAPLLALDNAGRLAVEVGALSVPRRNHRQRLEGEPRFDARTAHSLVALHRIERAIVRATRAHRDVRTATNQMPSCRTSPPPSSRARPRPVNQRL